MYEPDDIKYLDILGIKPHYYRITYDGNIINESGLVMKPFVSNRGYLRINLSLRNGKQKKFSIHRLVALMFIPNDDPVNKPIVNHLDGDRTNNDYTNLEWTDDSGNMIHAYDNDLAYTKGANCHLSKPDIYSDEIIHKMCRLFEKQIRTRDVIKLLHLTEDLYYKNPEYNRYKHYINDLRRRKLRRDITSQYNF